MYCGPRFYRVNFTHKRDGHRTGYTYGENASAARAQAKSLAAADWATDVVLETIDDRYPANVIEGLDYPDTD